MRQRKSLYSPEHIGRISSDVWEEFRYCHPSELEWSPVFESVKRKVREQNYQRIADLTKDVFSDIWRQHKQELSRQAKERHREYLQSRKWKERREIKLMIADRTCERCGDEACEVHHTSYSNMGAESLRDELSDLEALCGSCHHRHHKK